MSTISPLQDAKIKENLKEWEALQQLFIDSEDLRLVHGCRAYDGKLAVETLVLLLRKLTQQPTQFQIRQRCIAQLLLFSWAHSDYKQVDKALNVIVRFFHDIPLIFFYDFIKQLGEFGCPPYVAMSLLNSFEDEHHSLPRSLFVAATRITNHTAPSFEQRGYMMGMGKNRFCNLAMESKGIIDVPTPIAAFSKEKFPVRLEMHPTFTVIHQKKHGTDRLFTGRMRDATGSTQSEDQIATSPQPLPNTPVDPSKRRQPPTPRPLPTFDVAFSDRKVVVSLRPIPGYSECFNVVAVDHTHIAHEMPVEVYVEGIHLPSEGIMFRWLRVTSSSHPEGPRLYATLQLIDGQNADPSLYRGRLGVIGATKKRPAFLQLHLQGMMGAEVVSLAECTPDGSDLLFCTQQPHRGRGPRDALDDREWAVLGGRMEGDDDNRRINQMADQFGAFSMGGEYTLREERKPRLEGDAISIVCEAGKIVSAKRAQWMPQSEYVATMLLYSDDLHVPFDAWVVLLAEEVLTRPTTLRNESTARLLALLQLADFLLMPSLVEDVVHVVLFQAHASSIDSSISSLLSVPSAASPLVENLARRPWLLLHWRLSTLPRHLLVEVCELALGSTSPQAFKNSNGKICFVSLMPRTKEEIYGEDAVDEWDDELQEWPGYDDFIRKSRVEDSYLVLPEDPRPMGRPSVSFADNTKDSEEKPSNGRRRSGGSRTEKPVERSPSPVEKTETELSEKESLATAWAVPPPPLAVSPSAAWPSPSTSTPRDAHRPWGDGSGGRSRQLSLTSIQQEEEERARERGRRKTESTPRRQQTPKWTGWKDNAKVAVEDSPRASLASIMQSQHEKASGDGRPSGPSVQVIQKEEAAMTLIRQLYEYQIHPWEMVSVERVPRDEERRQPLWSADKDLVF